MGFLCFNSKKSCWRKNVNIEEMGEGGGRKFQYFVQQAYKNIVGKEGYLEGDFHSPLSNRMNRLLRDTVQCSIIRHNKNQQPERPMQVTGMEMRF